MAITRVSTYNTHLIAIDTLQKRQAAIAETQDKVSSGVKYDSLAEMAFEGQTRRVVDFSSTLNQITNYERNNEIERTRLNTMDNSINGLEGMMQEALQVMTQERSGVGGDVPLRQQLESILQRMQDQLNVSAGGRYLFSGSKTTDKPVTGILTSNLLGDGSNGVSDIYYNGDGTDLYHQASDDVSIVTTIRANDPAFQKMIGALHLAMQAEDNGSSSQLSSAIDLANEGLNEVVGVRNRLRNNISTLDTVTTQHENLKTYYKQTIGELMGTNVAEASIELAMDESILTASFQIFARVSNLTLSNFLPN